MVKKFLLVIVIVLICGTAFALDFTKVNSTLGPKSYTTSVYGGLLTSNIGVNLEWGIGELPLTVGLGISPLAIGEYAVRIGYHPDLGIDKWDLYANLTLGMGSVLFIPLGVTAGIHVGGRYYFGTTRFGMFGELGFSTLGNYVKLGLSFK